MVLAKLFAILVLTLILLTSYIATISFFAPLFGEQINLTEFHKFIVALYIPHYLFIPLVTIYKKGRVLDDDTLDLIFSYFICMAAYIIIIFCNFCCK